MHFGRHAKEGAIAPLHPRLGSKLAELRLIKVSDWLKLVISNWLRCA